MAYLNERYANMLKRNEADTYESYLLKSGIRTDERYYDSLAKADTVRRLADSNYGTTAESLRSKGLNESGYEDYVKSRASTSYYKGVGAAELGKKSDEYENRRGYENYLAGYESLQSKISESVISKIASGMNFNLDDAFGEAVRAGVARNLAYVTAQSGVRKAKENAMYKAIQYAKINKLSANQAKEYALSLGLEETYAKNVYKEISALTENEKNYYASMTAGDYYGYIKSQANK